MTADSTWSGVAGARLRLSLISEPGDVRMAELVAAAGAEEAVRACVRDEPLAGGLPTATWVARARDLDLLERSAIETAGRFGMRWVCPGDDEWPDAVASLDYAEPIRSVGGAPLGLWLRGPLRLDEAMRSSVAIVGARAATTYGHQVAGDLAAEVAVEGCTVVSGGAFGIDIAAHRGALAVRKPTVCVLASGLDIAYPRAHAAVFEQLAEDGLLVSEQPPSQSPIRGRFLTRNRLIAAITQGTVVVEAARRSGSLNTLNWAQRCGRVAMGVPGAVTSSASVGVHHAIRSGGAVLVTRAGEVLEAIGAIGESDATLPWVPPTGTDRLSVPARRIFEQVPGDAPAATETVAARVPCRPAEVDLVLGALMDLGFVERTHQGWRAIRQERRAHLS